MAQVALALVACGGGSLGADGSDGSGGGGSVEPRVVLPPCKQGPLVSGAPPTPDPRVRETHSGTNGEFTDTCENGALVQYECGTSTITGPPEDPATWTSGTGAVVSKTIDCGGRCVNGACPDACPNIGDRMRCLSVAAGGRTKWESITSGWTYECDVNSLAGCITMPEPGATLDVVWSPDMLLTSTDCVTEVYFAVGVGTEATCWYAPCSATAP